MAKPKNYIVQRHSPDWLNFDLESSRAFLIGANIEPNVVIDFATIWDRTFAIDYRHFRQRVKDVSTRNYEAVTGATVLDLKDFQNLRRRDDDLIMFVDDDDWLRADVFEIVRGAGPVGDGARWGNIIVGGEFKLNSNAIGPRQIEIRAIAPWLYTNNYAVSGKALDRLGIPAMLEHLAAQSCMNAGRFQPSVVRRYLSVAHKHPCSTIAARRYLEEGAFKTDPRRVIAAHREALGSETYTSDTQWTAPLVAQMLELLDEALAQ